MESVKKGRLQYLDMAKGIGIILVVIGHSTFENETLMSVIASFHMPMFFVISGMLIRYTGEEKKPFGKIVERKMRTITLPYLLFSAINLLIIFTNMLIQPQVTTFTDLYRAFIEFFTLYGVSVLWFLPVLFTSELLFIAVRKRCPQWLTVGIFVILGLAASIGKPLFDINYPMYYSMPVLWVGYFLTMLLRSFLACIFLSFGYVALPLVEGFGEKDFKWKNPAFILLGASCMAVNILFGLKNGNVDMHFMIFHNIGYYFICSLCGSLGVILICKGCKTVRLLRYAGENSLIIMGTHTDCRILLIAINTALWICQFITVTMVRDIVLIAIVIGITFLLETAAILIFNHRLYWMMGKKRPVMTIKEEVLSWFSKRDKGMNEGQEKHI